MLLIGKGLRQRKNENKMKNVHRRFRRFAISPMLANKKSRPFHRVMQRTALFD